MKQPTNSDFQKRDEMNNPESGIHEDSVFRDLSKKQRWQEFAHRHSCSSGNNPCNFDRKYRLERYKNDCPETILIYPSFHKWVTAQIIWNSDLFADDSGIIATHLSNACPRLHTSATSKGFQTAAADINIAITKGSGIKDRFITKTIANIDK